MKICVTAVAGSLDARVDPRFGRCPYFLIVDPRDHQVRGDSKRSSRCDEWGWNTSSPNRGKQRSETLNTGNVGPNAFQALSAAGIKVVTGAFGTVREVIEKYKRGELKETGAPTVRGHFGMGMGRGRGWRG